jgi:hypothetical protein
MTWTRRWTFRRERNSCTTAAKRDVDAIVGDAQLVCYRRCRLLRQGVRVSGNMLASANFGCTALIARAGQFELVANKLAQRVKLYEQRLIALSGNICNFQKSVSFAPKILSRLLASGVSPLQPKRAH